MQTSAQPNDAVAPAPPSGRAGWDVAALALPVFAFYLVVFCNFTKETVGCRLQAYLDDSMIAKHALGFLMLLFLVVLANPTNADRKLGRCVLIAAMAYVLFILTTRNPFPVTLVVLAILFVVYILGITRDRYEHDGDVLAAKRVRMVQTILTFVMFGVSAVGFVVYYVEKRREYGGAFTLYRFVVGGKSCRRFTPPQARVMRAFDP